MCVFCSEKRPLEPYYFIPLKYLLNSKEGKLKELLTVTCKPVVTCGRRRGPKRRVALRVVGKPAPGVGTVVGTYSYEGRGGRSGCFRGKGGVRGV